MDVNFKMDADANELYHYGRKGMKWYQNIYTAAKNAKTKLKRRAALKKARETRKKNVEAEKKRQDLLKKGKLPAKQMTPKELEERIKKLELEKRYRDLKKEEISTSRGKKFIDRFLDSSVEKVADAGADIVAQTIKTFGVNAVNKKVFDGKEETFTNNKKK
jgi:hypothetical protein